MKHLVFFASGAGTNFQTVINAVQTGAIDAKIKGLIADKTNIGAIKRAKKNHIPIRIIPNNAANFDTRLMETLKAWHPDLIVLAGYVLKIPSRIIEAFPGRIINIHPALLPKFGGKGFYGKKVHQAVLEAGETKSGCSVHIVTESYDKGPVLAQKTVPVHDSDTPKSLAERVLKQEHKLLPEVIKNYLPKL